MANSDFSCGQTRLFLEVAIAQRFSIRRWKDIDQSVLYISRLGKHTKSEKSFPIARCLLPADMLERWLHVCCVRVKITFTIIPTNCFVSTTMNSIKCPVNWILDSTERTSSFEKYPAPPEFLLFPGWRITNIISGLSRW